MSRAPQHETPAEAHRRQASEATREVLEEFEDEYGLCVTALALDGMLDGIAAYLTSRVGQDAAALKLRNFADAMARRAPHLRLVQEN